MGDFGGACLVKFIHLRSSYMIFGYWQFLSVLFWVIFGFANV